MVKSDFKFTETDYVLVGGFDSEKYKGCIKLFKIIYDDISFKNKTEFIQDIEVYDKIKGPVSCIIQEKYSLDKNILVSSWDGNIYSFSGPYINPYIKQYIDMDNKNEINQFYEEFFSSRD